MCIVTTHFFTKYRRFVLSFLIVFFSWICISILFIYFVAKNPFTVAAPFSKNIFVENSNTQLLAGKIVKGKIFASQDNLGIIAVRFTTFSRINHDKIIFRIKPEDVSSWYYENTYKVDQFQPNQLFPFGFPLISQAKNKQFVFELQSLYGKPGDAVSLNTDFPAVEAMYNFPKKKVLNSPKLFLLLLYKKYTNLWIDPVFAFWLFSSYILVLWLVFIYLKRKKFISLRNAFAWKTFKELFCYLKKNPLPLIIISGLFLRLFLAFGPYNADTLAAFDDAKIFLSHKYNIYYETTTYNYSPVFYFVIGVLGYVQSFLKIFPYVFIYRAFFAFIDVITLFTLMRIAKYRNVNSLKVGALFFLNPISIIISGHHGQFENVAILFILLAVLLYYKNAINKKQKQIYLWLTITVALLIKHIIIFDLITYIKYIYKNNLKVFILFAISLLVFLLTFVPFMFTAKNQIIKQVFMYGGIQGVYGINYYIENLCVACSIFGINLMIIYKYIFVISLFFFSLFIRKNDIIRSLLLSTLFFLAFTSGIATQYFILPVALGVFSPTKWFYLYTIIITIFFLGRSEELNIRTFQDISFNTAWIFVLLWFFSELAYVIKPLKNLYKKIL